jgi:hypothetical protein
MGWTVKLKSNQRGNGNAECRDDLRKEEDV